MAIFKGSKPLKSQQFIYIYIYISLKYTGPILQILCYLHSSCEHEEAIYRYNKIYLKQSQNKFNTRWMVKQRYARTRYNP